MAEVLRAEDVQTLYEGCLVIYNNALVKVISIDFDERPFTFTLLNLSTQKKLKVPFKQEDFKNPEKRIGFVNIMQSVVYIVRNPVRKYHLGINKQNIEVRCPAVNYPNDRSRTRDKALALNSVEVYKAYAGIYPSLEEAYASAKEWESACAFDKQFCVDCKEIIFYKDKRVGKLVDSVIVFDKDFSYLECALGNNYEKDSRTFKAASL